MSTDTTKSNADPFADLPFDNSASTSSRNASRTFETIKKEDAHGQRTKTTRCIETEILRVLKWENPIRSGVILLMLMGSLILTHQYSLIQIFSAALTLAVSINLVYVGVTNFSQTVLADLPPINPYNQILEEKEEYLLNKGYAIHYSGICVDVAETVARALNRIIFIDDTMTSLKWLCIFFITWRISAYVSSRVIIAAFIISAFIMPRLYITNKDIIDARLLQSQALINNQLKNAQEFANSKLGHVKEAAQGYLHQEKKAD